MPAGPFVNGFPVALKDILAKGVGSRRGENDRASAGILVGENDAVGKLHRVSIDRPAAYVNKSARVGRATVQLPDDGRILAVIAGLELARVVGLSQGRMQIPHLIQNVRLGNYVLGDANQIRN